MLKRNKSRFVNIEIQIQQTNHQLGILLQILGNGFRRVTANQFNFWDVTDKAVHIEEVNALLQVIVGVHGKASPLCFGRLTRSILFGDVGKSAERIKTCDPALMVGWLENRTELCPSHKASAAQHAAFNDGALNFEHPLKNFVPHEKIRNFLARGIEAKVPKFLDTGEGTFNDASLHLLSVTLLFVGTRGAWPGGFCSGHLSLFPS